ncbi:hypothetical protein PQE70_gp078 [Bacillus phage vB_BanS_Nate]|uniref:Uncharacterized protein n=1 Tax=Bacillus phage vB_BanS_Nate TaxID=2894788 RepID=A0AAE8YUT2_9CAUD|nr:hypothetical protein PQE70_gp078 [Bacillus phage vB_BanS_Nate]UGO50931.1 hypothetical protein NATE_78 [Bacillus phage vB_BanS_Nate]
MRHFFEAIKMLGIVITCFALVLLPLIIVSAFVQLSVVFEVLLLLLGVVFMLTYQSWLVDRWNRRLWS